MTFTRKVKTKVPQRGGWDQTQSYFLTQNVTGNPRDANASFSSSSQLSPVKGQLMSTLLCYRQMNKFPGKIFEYVKIFGKHTERVREG